MKHDLPTIKALPHTLIENGQLHDHDVCLKDALTTAEALCKKRGVQLTVIRQQILTLIWSSHKAVKAYELLEKLKPLQNAAKPATIYRALDFLIEQGLIHRIESLNAFIGCNFPDLEHEKLLFICACCNEVEERIAPNVMKTLAAEIKQAGFLAQNKAIEIRGICKNCAAT